MYRNCKYQNQCNCSCSCNKSDKEDVIEDICENAAPIYTCEEYSKKSCECGFDEESPFPANPMLGQSYVPIQRMNKTFTPCVGLKMGTIFPELVSPYAPGQSMAEIEYIRRTNEIGEGCNKC